MCTANGKQHLAILGLLVGLVPTTGQAGDAQRGGPSRSAAPAREAAPTPGTEATKEGASSPKQKGLSNPKAMPAQSPRARQPGTGLRKTAPTQAGNSLPGGAQFGKNNQFGSSLFCGEGFVKAILPDDPNGLYACRIAAGPMCTEGYESRKVKRAQNRFWYQCTGEGQPQICPQGWTLSEPTGITDGEYNCFSSELTCRSDHEFDSIHLDPIDAAPNPSQVVFIYRCKPR